MGQPELPTGKEVSQHRGDMRVFLSLGQPFTAGTSDLRFNEAPLMGLLFLYRIWLLRR
jgi:hypothetical protein